MRFSTVNYNPYVQT